ncbi:MAG: Hsp20/alpha crystallin family protein, partial [Chitinophagales bacterium]
MERAVDKPRNTWPTLFDSGWMEKFFNAPLDEFFNFGKAMNIPAVNIAETDKEFKLTMAIPGLEKSDFKIESVENMLTISAEKENEKEEKTGRYNRREYNYNSWSRTFTLPEYVDAGHIEANYEKGELKILLPKTEVAKPRKVKTINVK